MFSLLQNNGLLALLSLALATQTSAATLPQPNGTYGVDVRVVKLTDASRLDPYASTPEKRSVLTSVFYPTTLMADCDTYTAAYFPPKTAAIQDEYYASYGIPNGTWQSLNMSLCDASCSGPGRSKFPVALFSPGSGNTRLLYNEIAQSVASQGFVVITIDHPGDASVVEFPDGELVYAANISTDAQIIQSLDIRAQDASFILDQLHNASSPIVAALPQGLRQSFQAKSMAMFGHSLGGATSAVVMANDSRIIVGANLDGSFFGPIIDKGVRNPFLLFGHDGKNQTEDESWGETWPHLGKGRLELMLKNESQHASFTDFPILLDTLGLTEMYPDVVAELVGVLPGTKVLEVITDCVVAFMEPYFGIRGSRNAMKKCKLLPEIEVIDE